MSVKTSNMPHRYHDTDLCIVGGGLTGLCAAVAAAREGVKVLLMQDRPMLGGNCSSEIRMWVRGAKGLHNRETGIISELEEENIYRNPTLCANVFDSVMWGKVKNEKNIELLLNCSCCDAEYTVKDGVSTITGVTGWQLTTYTWHTVRAKYFADCSGDSVLATVSGAKWRVGREGHNEYDEAMGHYTGDSNTMGMSCLLQARETDHKVEYIPPEWAYVFEKDEDFQISADKNALCDVSGSTVKNVVNLNRDHKLGTSLGNLWWIEMGGHTDSLHNTEEMRDELLKIVYGIWDHIKNRGDHGADNWELTWVGFLPGKRESRRYIGKYVLKEQDIEAGGKFEDTVAFGGWPMDDHNPSGFRSYLDSNPPSVLYPAPSPYGIPYRVVYGTDVSNMFFAGRNISATHAALSSTRVMATCATIGQAMGTAASICIKENETPDGVYLHRIKELQDKLMDQGCYLPGFVRSIPEISKNAALNITDSDREILFNGEERPDKAGKINYITLEKGKSLVYDFGKAVKLNGLRIMFDLDFSRESVSPNKKMKVFAQKTMEGKDFVPVKVAKTICRSFDVIIDGKTVYSADNNYHSLVRIPLDCTAQRAEIRFNDTWGEENVHIFSADFE